MIINEDKQNARCKGLMQLSKKIFQYSPDRAKKKWFCTLRVSVCMALLSSFSFLSNASAATVDLKSSTQFLWGDDLLGESHAVMAEYFRFNYTPEMEKFSMTGYWRVSNDFTDSQIRNNDLSARLYYMYMNYSPYENTTIRAGRQLVNFTAGSSIMDGVTLDVGGIGPIGMTIAGGTDVRFSLDGTHSMLGDYFLGMNFRLENIRATQLGVSYVRKYDEWDRAREELGLNFRRYMVYVSPYGEIRYDRLSKAMDQALLGLDVYPAKNLTIKGEFYHFYPTFDSTSVYSVFAVDRYREYRIQTEYSLEAPVTIFASYTRQTYDDDNNANVYSAGTYLYPTENLSLNVSIDRRSDFGGDIWGFESSGDYRASDKFTFSAGAQYDAYKRPSVEFSMDNAARYWVGGRWLFRENASIVARFEDNINENFYHQPTGRIILDWEL